jgi:hypothetical protein
VFRRRYIAGEGNSSRMSSKMERGVGGGDKDGGGGFCADVVE